MVLFNDPLPCPEPEVQAVRMAIEMREEMAGLARAWRRHLGPTGLIFTQRSEEGRRARAEAAAEDGGYETLVRDVGV